MVRYDTRTIACCSPFASKNFRRDSNPVDRVEKKIWFWRKSIVLSSFVSFSFFFSSLLFFRCRCVDTRTACVRAISLQRACNAWHEFRCEFSNRTIQSVRFFSFSFASFLSLSFFFFRRKFRSRYIQYFYTNLRYKDREILLENGFSFFYFFQRISGHFLPSLSLEISSAIKCSEIRITPSPFSSTEVWTNTRRVSKKRNKERKGRDYFTREWKARVWIEDTFDTRAKCGAFAPRSTVENRRGQACFPFF